MPNPFIYDEKVKPTIVQAIAAPRPTYGPSQFYTPASSTQPPYNYTFGYGTLPSSVGQSFNRVATALRPRITAHDLLGPVGQSALTSGLALSAFGGAPGFVSGALANLLAEEGARRFRETGMSPQYALPLATGLSMVAGAPLYKLYPGAATTDLAEEMLDSIPAGSITGSQH